MSSFLNTSLSIPFLRMKDKYEAELQAGLHNT